MSVWDALWGIFSALLVNEFCDISPWAARKLVRWSAHLRYTDPERAKIRAEELAALIDKRPGKLFKLVTATFFAASAVRAAMTRLIDRIPIFDADFAPNGTLASSQNGTFIIAASGAAASAALAAIVLALITSPGVTSYVIAPRNVGAFSLAPELMRQMNAIQLKQQVIARSSGQASHVVSAVYENSAGISGKSPSQIFLFIGGNLSGTSAADFIAGFRSQFRDAVLTSGGALGGRAVCVNAQSGRPGTGALCSWADNDTFGVLASPTMSSSKMAVELRYMRPYLERRGG